MENLESGKPLLSVVIPLYNSSAYLNDLFKSIDNQIFHNYELLIIDDGSSDNTYSKITEYAQINRRARIFHQENSGQSAARELGIQHARAPWVTFIDGDDYIASNHFEELAKEFLHTEASIIMVNVMRVDNDGNMLGLEMSGLTPGKYSGGKLREVWLNGVIPGFLWNKAFRKDDLKSIQIVFSENFMEDVRIVNELILRGAQIFFSDIATYYYRQHNDSSVHRAMRETEWEGMNQALLSMETIVTNPRELKLLRGRYIRSYSFLLRGTSSMWMKSHNREIRNVLNGPHMKWLQFGRLRDRLMIFIGKHFLWLFVLINPQ